MTVEKNVYLANILKNLKEKKKKKPKNIQKPKMKKLKLRHT
jgi:hypothetical protein